MMCVLNHTIMAFLKKAFEFLQISQFFFSFVACQSTYSHIKLPHIHQSAALLILSNLTQGTRIY